MITEELKLKHRIAGDRYIGACNRLLEAKGYGDSGSMSGLFEERDKALQELEDVREEIKNASNPLR